MTLRQLAWRLLGRRFGPRDGVLHFRAWWLAPWEKVRLVKTAPQVSVSEDVLRQLSHPWRNRSV